MRIPAGEIEQLVTDRVRQWLLDPGSIYQATRVSDPSTQRRLIARAAEIGKSWTELPGTRQRAFLTALFDRIDVGANRIDIHFRPTRLAALLDVAATPLSSATDDEIQILSIPVRLRRSGREITMRIDGTDPFATARADFTLGTPPNALTLARSEGHQSHFGAVPEDLLSHLATVNGERPKDLIRAEIVYFDTTAGGAVFSTGSITFCGSLSCNNYDNNVSRMLENVLRHFAGDHR